MKIIKFIQLLTMILLSYSLSAQSDTLNRLDSKGNKQGYWKKYEKDILLYEGRFVNDVPTGEFKYYHNNGNVKSISNFLNGTHRVQTVLYHINGKKSAEGLFVNQQKEGEWLYYSSSEILIKKESYKNGIKNGEWKTYSPQTGILIQEESYDNGILNGVQKVYYTTGELNTVQHFINGKRNGIAENYYLEEKLSSKGLYYNNLREGAWDFFDETGKIRKSVEFKKDREEKIYHYFYKGNTPQKLNQALVAYIQKSSNGIQVVTYDGKSFSFDTKFDELKYWFDHIEFVLITPSILSARDNILGYKKLNSEDEEDDEIEVVLKAAPPYQVIAKGDNAKMIKSFTIKPAPIQEED